MVKIIIFQGVGGFLENPNRLVRTSGGGLSGLLPLLPHWKKLNHDIEFVTNSLDSGASEYSKMFVTHVVPSFGTKFYHSKLQIFLVTFFSFAIQLTSMSKIIEHSIELEKKKAILLNVDGGISNVIVSVYLKRKYNIMPIVNFHHIPPGPLWYGRRRGSFIRNLLIYLNTSIALAIGKIFELTISLGNPDELRTRGWKYENVFSNLYPMDFGEFQQVSDNNKEYDASFLGRISPNKGIIDLIKVWKEVVRVSPTAKIILMGAKTDDKFIRRVERLIHKFNLVDNIIITGPVSEIVKRENLRNSRLFLFPSYEEGWGISITEAIVNGSLPIVYDLPAYNYLGKSLPKVRVGDTENMVRYVMRFIDDSVLRQKIVAELRSIMKSYISENVAKVNLDSILKACNFECNKGGQRVDN